MLPDDIANSYREYKADTEIFVTWLVETASRCGFVPSTTAPSHATAAATGGRLKGKARAAEPKVRSQACKITINDLKTCATAVVEKPPKKFAVPLYASRAAARAIRHRTKSTLWHEAQTQNVDEDLQHAFAASNEAHATFTGTLEYALDLLKPFITTGKAIPKPDEHITPPSVNGLNTRFSSLEIEDLADQEPESGGQAAATAKPAPTSKTTYTVDNQKDDCLIAMSMLVRDYNQIKVVIQTTWARYCRKDTDLVSTAATTQAAMQMIKSLVHEFSLSFPEIRNVESFWHTFFADSEICKTMRRDTDEIRAMQHTLRGNERRCEVKIPDVLLTYGCLQSYIHIWDVLQHIEPYVESGDVAYLTFPDRKSQQLSNALDDIVWMIRRVHYPLPTVDNFTLAWYTYLNRRNCEDRKPTDQTRYGGNISLEMWLYTDLYLVAQDAVSSQNPGLVLEDYQNIWTYVDRGGFLQDVLTTSPLLESPWGRTNLNSFFRDPSDAMQRLIWLSSDPIWNSRLASARQTHGHDETWSPITYENRNHSDWVTMNPFLAGTISFVVMHAANDLLLLMQNGNGLVLGYAHLYNFLHNAHSANEADSSEKLVTKEWKDIDNAIALLGESSIFMGSRPTALDQCTNRLVRAHGMKASDIARTNGRGKKKQIVSVGGKMSVHSTPLINLLFSDGGPSNTTFLNITNRAISELLMKETETYNSDILPQKLFSGPEVAGPLFMLRVLLQRELPALLFPLEQLHLSCKELNGPHDEYVAGLRPVEGEDAKLKRGETYFVPVKAGGEIEAVA
ncbi:hypothetical protein J4E89_000270 [Alternaria sp. Ai002NY15]|nr:hypothetical protein J4E89_000270 [Alternaria sp. Ai002NY15]